MRLSEFMNSEPGLDEDEMSRRFHDEQDLMIELSEWADRVSDKASGNPWVDPLRAREGWGR